MPPISPQGSRGGLITAVVIFVIGFVTSTIFAIFYGVQNNKTEALYKQADDRLKIIARDTTNANYTYFLTYAQSHPNLPEATVVGAMSYTVGSLNEKIMGSGDPAAATRPAVGLERAQEAVSEAAKASGLDLPDNLSLVEVIDRQGKRIADLNKQLADARDQQSAFTRNTLGTIGNVNDQMTGLQKQVDDLNKKLVDAQAQNDKLHQEYVDDTTKQNLAMDADRQKFNETVSTLNTREADLNTTLADKTKLYNQILAKLSATRIHPEDLMTAQADGSITSVAPDDLVFINLGKGDHVVVGMPFEVYARNDGIPKLGNGLSGDSMPVGVGSIEVQRVLADTCQCKVTKRENGKHIQKGDLIANVVYNRNIKYNFYVFGKFDLAQLKHPTDQDRETIQGLITQWGGKVQTEEVTMDVDFVVMGSEPVITDLSQEDQSDPFVTKQKADQEAAVKAYQAVLDKARDLHIPIMNQNRFLYFCGYYDSAGK